MLPQLCCTALPCRTATPHYIISVTKLSTVTSTITDDNKAAVCDSEWSTLKSMPRPVTLRSSIQDYYLAKIQVALVEIFTENSISNIWTVSHVFVSCVATVVSNSLLLVNHLFLVMPTYETSDVCLAIGRIKYNHRLYRKYSNPRLITCTFSAKFYGSA